MLCEVWGRQPIKEDWILERAVFSVLISVVAMQLLAVKVMCLLIPGSFFLFYFSFHDFRCR